MLARRVGDPRVEVGELLGHVLGELVEREHGAELLQRIHDRAELVRRHLEDERRSRAGPLVRSLVAHVVDVGGGDTATAGRHGRGDLVDGRCDVIGLQRRPRLDGDGLTRDLHRGGDVGGLARAASGVLGGERLGGGRLVPVHVGRIGPTGRFRRHERTVSVLPSLRHSGWAWELTSLPSTRSSRANTVPSPGSNCVAAGCRAKCNGGWSPLVGCESWSRASPSWPHRRTHGTAGCRSACWLSVRRPGSATRPPRRCTDSIGGQACACSTDCSSTVVGRPCSSGDSWRWSVARAFRGQRHRWCSGARGATLPVWTSCSANRAWSLKSRGASATRRHPSAAATPSVAMSSSTSGCVSTSTRGHTSRSGRRGWSARSGRVSTRFSGNAGLGG